MNDVEYALRAQQFRPTNLAALAQEVRRQLAAGFTFRDISTTLRIAEQSARSLAFLDQKNTLTDAGAR